MKFERVILEYSPEEVPYQPGGRESSVPCARFLEADWLTHGHVTRARDCHVVVTRSAALSSCDNSGYNEIACLSGGTAREEFYLDLLDWASLSLLTATSHVITYFRPREKDGSYSAP